MRQKGEERELDGARVGEEGDGSEVLPREYQGALQLVVVAVVVRVVVVVRVPQLVFRLLRPSSSLTRCHSLHRLGVSLAGVFRLVFVLVFVRVFVHLFLCQPVLFLFLHLRLFIRLCMLMLVLLRLRLFIRLFLLPCQLQPVLSLRLLLRPRQLQHQLFSSLPPASGPRALFSSLPRERRGHWPGQGHARLSSRYGG